MLKLKLLLAALVVFLLAAFLWEDPFFIPVRRIGGRGTPNVILATPTGIVSNQVVNLQCGATYRGQLNLNGLTGVTVQTVGTCARATITTAVPVTGWSVYSGNIYVADVAAQSYQVLVDKVYVQEATYPNNVDETAWINPVSTTANTITVSSLPNSDIIGASGTFRGYDWQLGTRVVTGFASNVITFAAQGSAGGYADDTPLAKFYLQGKKWMIDQPGEWAWEAGKLYIWMPDSSNPGTRVLASPNTDVVDAANTSNVLLDKVNILGGAYCVQGYNSNFLKVTNSDVSYCSEGISIIGSNNSTTDNVNVSYIIHSGVNGGYSGNGHTVKNSHFTNVNMIGMHKGSDGSIAFSDGNNATVTNNTIVNSGKTGISLGNTNGSYADSNVVDNACNIHADCGGIYIYARDQITLATTISNNTIRNVNGTTQTQFGPQRYGLYLDDHANGVTLTGNSVTNGYTGLLMHGAFNNTVSGNTFSGNSNNHIYYSESSFANGSMYNNTISNNTFTGPVLAHLMQVAFPLTAATFSGNTYLNYGGNPVGSPTGPSY